MIIKMYGYTLNVNEQTGAITGETFNVKKQLKDIFDCKYDGNTKSWIIDTKNINRLLTHISVTVAKQDEQSKQSSVTTKSNQKCKFCGGYCYGDCQSN